MTSKDEIFKILMEIGQGTASQIYQYVSFQRRSGSFDRLKRILNEMQAENTIHQPTPGIYAAGASFNTNKPEPKQLNLF